MIFKTLANKELGLLAEYSIFDNNEVKEIHAILHLDTTTEPFATQLERIYKSQVFLFATADFKEATPIFKRYFLSDSTNQAPLMKAETCATSVIQQPPLNGSKIALWVYLQTHTEVFHNEAFTLVKHNGYEHFYQMGLYNTQETAYQQTEQILQSYEKTLQENKLNLLHNCIRTWFFVRDVDTQYKGLVEARLKNFLAEGLTPDTHYISSTGIGGLPANQKAIVQMDAYAIKHLQPEQQQFLYALTHLNPTIEYGVTFERGTAVKYGDRTHAYISGTASIDNKGNVLHLGDIQQQTLRMWENVEKLLSEVNMNLKDNAAQILVYLRDIGDYAIVKAMFKQHFSHIPTLIVLAPVCRPEWLIEMECIAISPTNNATFKSF